MTDILVIPGNKSAADLIDKIIYMFGQLNVDFQEREEYFVILLGETELSPQQEDFLRSLECPMFIFKNGIDKHKLN